MTRAFARRAQRVLGIANDLLGDSKWTIWCFEPEHMPAMIDLLIAQGSLGESDRPHCVHWTALSGSAEPTQDDLGRILDADEMLDKAGIRTRTGEGWKARLRGLDALQAVYREWFGEPSPDDLEAVAELEMRAQPVAEAGARAFEDREPR